MTSDTRIGGQNDTARVRQGAGMRLARGMALVAAVSLAASAQAAYKNWKGRATAPSYWNVDANWHISGSVTTGNNWNFLPSASGDSAATDFTPGWN